MARCELTLLAHVIGAAAAPLDLHVAMKRRTTSRLRRALLCFAYAALAAKLIVPVGYMPAALSDGSFVRLCPGGLPNGLLETAPGRADQGTDGEQSDHDEASIWEHCWLGSLAATPAMAACEHNFDVLGTAAETIAVTQAVPGKAFRALGFRARAPPQTLS